MKKTIRTKFRAEYPSEFVFDYKDPVTIYRFITDGGKIVPSRISKLSNYQQRQATKAVKRARALSLIPVGMDAYNRFERPSQISATPFELD